MRDIVLNLLLVFATIGWFAMAGGLLLATTLLPRENQEAMQDVDFFEVPFRQQAAIAREHILLAIAAQKLRERYPILRVYPPAVGTASQPHVYVEENRKLLKELDASTLPDKVVDTYLEQLKKDEADVAQSKLLESEEATESRMQRLLWALGLRTLLFAAGLAAMFYWWKSRPEPVFPEENYNETRRRLWTWRTTYGVVLAVAYLVALTIFGVMLLPPGFVRSQTYASFDMLSGIFLGVLAWSILFAVSRIRTVPLSVVAAWRLPATASQWKTVVKFGVCGYLITYALETFIECAYVLVTGLVPDSTNPVGVALAASALSHNVSNLVMYLVAIGITAPITEEPLFRGFLYSALRGFWGVPAAAMVSGAVFAIVHGDLPGFWELWAFGIMAAVFLQRSGTLLVPMIIHGLSNSLELFEMAILWWK